MGSFLNDHPYLNSQKKWQNITAISIRATALTFFVIFCLLAVSPFMLGSEEPGASPPSRAGEISFTMELIFDDPVDDKGLVLNPGEKYYLYVSLTNTGDINDSYQLSILNIPPGWLIAFSDKSTDSEIAVPAGHYGSNNADELVIINVPESAKKGEFDIAFEAVSVESLSSTVQKATEYLTVRVDYVMPYILLESAEKDMMIKPGGEPASFIIDVKNIGFETLSYYPPGSDELSLPEGWTGVIDSNENPIQLSSGASASFVLNISAPKNAGVQEIARIEVKGRTSSLNSTILPVELTVTVEHIHNLELKADSYVQVLSPFEEVSYSASVTNSGNGPESLSIEVYVPDYASAWNVHATESTLILPVGTQYSFNINFTPDKNAVNDEYIFELEITVLEYGVEVQYEKFQTIVEIRYVPDLSVETSDITFSDNFLQPSQGTMINVTVHNIGIIPAKNVSVDFVLQTQAGSEKHIGVVVLPLVRPGESVTASIEWTVDPATSLIIVKVDPSNDRQEISEENNIASQSVLIIQPPPDIPTGKGDNSGGVAGIGTLGAVVVLTALITITSVMALVTLNTEAGRYSLSTLFMPLYSKVRREDVLMHETRELVYDYVKSHPGDHFRAIMNKLSLTNGTLAHHLYTLEKQEFIKSERDGPYKRFYPHGYKFEGSVMEINGLQKKILDIIESNPGISQKRLASLLGISPPTVNYHIKTMVGARLVELQRNGKETGCFRIKAE